MTRRSYPICLWCKHFDAEESFRIKRCSAFPDNIPEEIWGGEYGSSFDHRLPYPDDKGIQFVKVDYTILQKRDFFDRFPSEESLDSMFEFSIRFLRESHETRIRIAQNPPKTHYIVPLDLPEAQALRDRCKEWSFDLSLRDNQVVISGELYQKIYHNLHAYVKWLEASFTNARTPKEGAMVFGNIVDALIREQYP